MSYIKKKSDKQEKAVAKQIGGRTQPASGALSGAKGDVTHPLLLVECKFTDTTYYTLTYKTWIKIKTEATRQGLKIPCMFIDVKMSKLVVVEEAFLIQMCELLGKKSVRKIEYKPVNSFRIFDDDLFESYDGSLIDYDVIQLKEQRLVPLEQVDFQLLFDEWCKLVV